MGSWCTVVGPIRPLTTLEMRGDLLTLTVILLLLVVSVQPNPAPQLRSWYRLSRLFNGLLSLGGAEKTVEEAEDDIQDVPPQDYQVLQSFEGYEERRYPSVHYACTEMTYD